MSVLLPWEVTPVYARTQKQADVLWRCESRSYSYIVDADRDEYGVTAPRLEFDPWPVLRRTPKGAWIHFEDGLGRIERFVLLSARRRFAANTQPEALADFRDRRKRMRHVLEAKIKRCEFEIALATKHLENAK